LPHIHENRETAIANSFAATTGKAGSNSMRKPIPDNVKSADQVITCECGTKILLLPDLKATSDAIENHVAKHQKLESDLGKATAEAEGVRDALIAQALRKVGG